jgi:hypothetical protein
MVNKDISINKVVGKLLEYFGQDTFERNTLNNKHEFIDFWEGDLFAIGLKKQEKVIYISTYGFDSQEDMKYYVEFELIDNTSLETLEVVKQLDGISLENLIQEIKDFIK